MDINSNVLEGMLTDILPERMPREAKVRVAKLLTSNATNCSNGGEILSLLIGFNEDGSPVNRDE